MKTSTKAALAGGAAVVLLLGGVGTLAYWTDDATVDGGELNSGSIELTAADCAESDWTHTEDSSVVELVVPGDTITKTCAVTLVLEGDHIGADVTLDVESIEAVEGALGSELEATASIPTGSITTPGTHDVSVTIIVTFPYGGPISAPDPATGASNGSQDGTAVLDGLELVAVQTHED